MSRFTLLFALVLLLPSLASAEDSPAATPALPGAVKVAEFGDTPVVAWDTVDKWSFGGDRFHKTNHFYQPADPAVTHPWAMTEIDITTFFQQDVIDGWAPSLESLIGDKWKDAKKFMEDKKYGGSVHFVYVSTDKKFTLYHDKGKRRESRFESDVVPGGLEKFFSEPKPEQFVNVDGMKKDEAYKLAVERFKARLEWAAQIRRRNEEASSNKENPPPKETAPKDEPPQK